MEKRILGIGFLVAVGLLLLPAISRAQNTNTLSSQYSHWHGATTPPATILDESGCFTSFEPDPVLPSAGGRTCYRWIGSIPNANMLIVHVAGNAESQGGDYNNYEIPMETVTIGNDRSTSTDYAGPLSHGGSSKPCINGVTFQDFPDLTNFHGWMAIHQIGDFDSTFATLDSSLSRAHLGRVRLSSSHLVRGSLH